MTSSARYVHSIDSASFTYLKQSRAMNGAIMAGNTLFLDPFALRQWDDPEYKDTCIDFNKVISDSR